jgi:hypothetical protein
MATMQRVSSTATSITRRDGILRVTYHGTDVVTVFPNGKIVLNTNGYQTATTKTRMNQASNQFGLGFQVWQKDFEWFVDIDGRTIPYPVTPYALTIRNGSD